MSDLSKRWGLAGVVLLLEPEKPWVNQVPEENITKDEAHCAEHERQRGESQESIGKDSRQHVRANDQHQPSEILDPIVSVEEKQLSFLPFGYDSTVG